MRSDGASASYEAKQKEARDPSVPLLPLLHPIGRK